MTHIDPNHHEAIDQTANLAQQAEHRATRAHDAQRHATLHHGTTFAYGGQAQHAAMHARQMRSLNAKRLQQLARLHASMLKRSGQSAGSAGAHGVGSAHDANRRVTHDGKGQGGSGSGNGGQPRRPRDAKRLAVTVKRSTAAYGAGRTLRGRDAGLRVHAGANSGHGGGGGGGGSRDGSNGGGQGGGHSGNQSGNQGGRGNGRSPGENERRNERLSSNKSGPNEQGDPAHTGFDSGVPVLVGQATSPASALPSETMGASAHEASTLVSPADGLVAGAEKFVTAWTDKLLDLLDDMAMRPHMAVDQHALALSIAWVEAQHSFGHLRSGGVTAFTQRAAHRRAGRDNATSSSQPDPHQRLRDMHFLVPLVALNGDHPRPPRWRDGALARLANLQALAIARRPDA